MSRDPRRRSSRSRSRSRSRDREEEDNNKGPPTDPRGIPSAGAVPIPLVPVPAPPGAPPPIIPIASQQQPAPSLIPGMAAAVPPIPSMAVAPIPGLAGLPGATNPAVDKINRELFVGNTPPGTSETLLITFLTGAMKRTNLCKPNDTPIVTCRVNQKFAFIECASTEMANVALNLNGIPFMSSQLVDLGVAPLVIVYGSGGHVPDSYRSLKIVVRRWGRSAVRRAAAASSVGSSSSSSSFMSDATLPNNAEAEYDVSSHRHILLATRPHRRFRGGQ